MADNERKKIWDRKQERAIRVLEKRGIKGFRVLPSAEAPLVTYTRKPGERGAHP